MRLGEIPYLKMVGKTIVIPIQPLNRVKGDYPRTEVITRVNRLQKIYCQSGKVYQIDDICDVGAYLINNQSDIDIWL